MLMRYSLLVTMTSSCNLAFCQRFKINDLDEADKFQGLRITSNRPERTSYLSQPKHINKVLGRLEMSSAKYSATPMEFPSSNSFHGSYSDPAVQEKFRESTGTFLCVMICNLPDIVYAVDILLQHCKTH